MRRKKQARKTKPEPIQKYSEIVTGTEFERTPWEDLDFSLDMRGSSPEVERPIFLAVGLAIATNIAGDVLAVGDTRNNTTYKIASLLDLHERITTNRLDIDIEETTGYFFYSESDFDCLLRLLPFDQAEDLAINRKITIPELQIWYSPNSKLTLKSKGATIRIYALQNILPAYNLEEAVAKYGFSDKHGNSFRGSTNDLHNDSCSDNILEEAKTHQGLAIFAKYRLKQVIDLQKDELKNPSAWVDRDIRMSQLGIDRSSIPEEVYSEYYRGIHAPWVETFKKGYFETAYDYDINKAYAWAVGNLINVDSHSGSWIYSEKYEPDAAYGIVMCYIRLNPSSVSPIFLRLDSWVASVSGTFIERLTKSEIDFIYKHKLGIVKILYGYWFKPEIIEYPFYHKMRKRLAQYELAAKDNQVLKVVLRLMYTRIVGKFLARYEDLETGRWKPGPFFNPIYYVEAATTVKLKVAEAALLNPNSVISIATDGILTSSPLHSRPSRNQRKANPGLITSTAPGEFKLSTKGPAVVISANIAEVHGKASFFPLIQTILDKPEDTIYKFEVGERIKLCTALRGKNLARTGNLNLEAVHVNIRADNKRFWPRLPFVGKDLLVDRFGSAILSVEEALLQSNYRFHEQEDWLSKANTELRKKMSVERTI